MDEQLLVSGWGCLVGSGLSPAPTAQMCVQLSGP